MLKNLEKYKIYKGRIFILRKKKLIPGTNSEISGRDKVIFFERTKTFGEAVFVYDETNSKVKVTTINGKHIWIPKNCLLIELETKKSNKKLFDLIDHVTNSNLDNENKNLLITLIRDLI